jgi:hypothetical protein
LVQVADRMDNGINQTSSGRGNPGNPTRQTVISRIPGTTHKVLFGRSRAAPPHYSENFRCGPLLWGERLYRGGDYRDVVRPVNVR